MSNREDEILQFLKHVGDDCGEDEYEAYWAECEGQGEEDSCPDHRDCGICRFEYMKRKGWLNLDKS